MHALVERTDEKQYMPLTLKNNNWILTWKDVVISVVELFGPSVSQHAPIFQLLFARSSALQ